MKIIPAVLLWGLSGAGAAQKRLCWVPRGQLQGWGLARGGGLQGGHRAGPGLSWQAEEFHTLVQSFLGRLSESEKTLKYGVFPKEEAAVQECQNQLQVSASPHLQAHLRSCSRMSHCLSHWQPQPAHTTMWDAARRGVWGPQAP